VNKSMTTNPNKEREIIDSWHKNATPWIVAIQEHQIESRKLVTDRSIIDAVVSQNGKTILDLGCGEGWLTRELSARGLEVLGVDIVSTLIDRAMITSADRFKLVTYAEIATGKLDQKFDVVVANFSLFGDESVTDLFRSIPLLLNPQGSFIIQTLHPMISSEDLTYVDGWRSSTWDGFSDDFTDPAPYYFRTLATWVRLYHTNGFSLVKICEPLHPQTGKPAAIIFIGALIARK
jgi:2-polyprenyl-3-methyl-5-hydroxy-6-metoxy-1,4-benzoquinol methylase